MKKIITIVIITIITLSAPLLTLADASADLTRLLSNIKTMQASFSQVIYDNHHQAISQNTGTMGMSRPGKFRWEVTQPIPQTIIANNGRLWIYDPDLEQVTIRLLDKAANGTPGLMLTQSDTSLNTEFTVTETNKSPDGKQWFELRPKQSDSIFNSVKLGFQTNEVSNMQLTDNLGHLTYIAFQHIKTNAAVPSDLFVFVPKGKVDTIDETKQKPSKK